LHTHCTLARESAEKFRPGKPQDERSRTAMTARTRQNCAERLEDFR
jgi:hypothetical protein